MARRVILDLGANRGQNLNYYLQKAELVIAVEANPKLAKRISADYLEQIDAGRLVLLNAAIVAKDDLDSRNSHGMKRQNFYIHKQNDVLSTLIEPLDQEKFLKVKVPTVRIEEIFNIFGFREMHFLHCKIDLEGYDFKVVKEILGIGLLPDSISFECHDLESLNLIVNSGKYFAFKMLLGSKIERQFSNLKILNRNKEKVIFRFPPHSAGPFGEDVPGKWYSANGILEVMRIEGTGWIDICAVRSSLFEARDLGITEKYLRKFRISATRLWRKCVPEVVRIVLFRVRSKLRNYL